LWAEFGREAPFGKKFSSKGFGKENVWLVMRHNSAEGLFALGEGSFREYVMTWPGHKEGTN
jgi:hypothetical protein